MEDHQQGPTMALSATQNNDAGEGCSSLRRLGNKQKPSNKRPSTSKQQERTPAIKRSTAPKLDKRRITFPLKLFKLVNEAENLGYDHIVSWTPDGRSLLLKDIKKLEQEVLPKFFGHIKLRSLTRQLSYWSFSRLPGGPKGGLWQHPGFVRDNKDLLSTINRSKLKGCAIKRNEITINLRESATIEGRDQVVTSLEDVGLESMQMVVARNVEKYSASNEEEETDCSAPTENLPTMPRRVSYEPSRYDSLLTSSADQIEDPCDDISALDSNPRPTGTEDDTSSRTVPFEGRYFHDVEEQEDTSPPSSKPSTLPAETHDCDNHNITVHQTNNGTHRCVSPNNFAATGMEPINQVVDCSDCYYIPYYPQDRRSVALKSDDLQFPEELEEGTCFVTCHDLSKTYESSTSDEEGEECSSLQGLEDLIDDFAEV
jgi:hypothetical protein